MPRLFGGSKDKSVEHLQRSLTYDPTSAASRYFLAETYLEMVEAGELPIGGSESLDPSDAYLEEVFLRLRILEGVPSSWFEP